MSHEPEPEAYEAEERPSRRPGPLLISLGVVVVLIAVAAFLLFRPDRPTQTASTATTGSGGGLQVDVSQAPTDAIQADQPLRCFVDGRFVGLLTLAECARRNGVEPGALDVGVDESGALAAATDTQLEPLPPALNEQVQTAQLEATRDLSPNLPPLEPPAPRPPEPRRATGPCWRDAGGGNWVRVADDVSLAACTAALFDGQCVVQPGAALYGRWAEETLRLVPGRVEAGGSGGRFRTLAEQAPGSCSVVQ